MNFHMNLFRLFINFMVKNGHFDHGPYRKLLLIIKIMKNHMNKKNERFDARKSERVMNAMLQMKKIDIEGLMQAFRTA